MRYVLLLLLWASAAQALNIPLTIQELLPANDAGGYPPTDVTGTNRTDEPVTSGVPLLSTDNITSTAQLAVVDTLNGNTPVDAQFRVLKRHCTESAPGCEADTSRPIQWVLVDLQASVTANGTNTQYALTTGTNPASGTLATDNGTTITVATGAATFTIKKANQNVIDTAVVGATTLITTGHSGGLVHTDQNSVTYSSINDASSTATIEENGPLRAVVKETGRLISAGAAKTFGYTIRLHFFKNKEYVRAFVIVQNAYSDALVRQQLGYLELMLPLTVGIPQTVTFSTSTSSTSATLDTLAYLYQAYTSHKATSEAVAIGSYASPFKYEGEWMGLPFTWAKLGVAAPAYVGGTTPDKSVYSASLVGTSLGVSIDGGATQTVSFVAGDFANPSAPKADEVVTKIYNTLNTPTLIANVAIEGRYSGSPGALYIQSRNTVNAITPSVAITSGNAIIGWTTGQRDDGQLGYITKNGATTVHALGGATDYTRGFGDVSDGSNIGLTVAMRDFDEWFPTSIEFDSSGNAVVGLWSRRNTHQGCCGGGQQFDWEEHETREMIWDFHASAAAPEAIYAFAQYPLFLRAPFTQYAQSGGFLGRTHLLTVAEIAAYHTGNNITGFNQFAEANYPTYHLSTYDVPNEQIIRMRSYSWGQGGLQNNTEQIAPKLLTFLSTGHGGLFHAAYRLAYFVADQAIRHSDGFDFGTQDVTGMEGTAYTGGFWNLMNGGAEYTGWENKFESDMEHEHTLGLPMLYYVTGDEALRDAVVDHGEWLYGASHIGSGLCWIGNRSSAMQATWEALLWEMTGISRYGTQIENYAQMYACPVSTSTTTVGQDIDRGFYRNCTDSNCTGTGSPTDNVIGDGQYELWRVLPNSSLYKEDLGDRMLGHAYWMSREPYFDMAGSQYMHGIGGYKPAGNWYYFDQSPGDDSLFTRLSIHTYMGLLAYGYRHTHDSTMLYVARRMLSAQGSLTGLTNGSLEEVAQGYVTYSNFESQDLMTADSTQDTFGTTFLNDDPGTYGGLTVTNNGGGSYTLSWTVPSQAVSYQIKYGPQIMVPYLGFDKYARTYTYDPATYDNFWAVNGNNGAVTNQPHNISNEPTPGIPGTTQTYTITGMTGTPHFALRITTGTGGTARLAAPWLLR